MTRLSMVIAFMLSSMTGFNQSCNSRQDNLSEKKYYIIADKMPSYKGGSKILQQTINKNLKWPGGRCCFEGTIIISFIVEPSGKTTNYQITKGISNEEPCNADKSALTAVQSLTEWIPGECEGVKVPVKLAIPVRFEQP